MKYSDVSYNKEILGKRKLETWTVKENLFKQQDRDRVKDFDASC